MSLPVSLFAILAVIVFASILLTFVIWAYYRFYVGIYFFLFSCRRRLRRFLYWISSRTKITYRNVRSFLKYSVWVKFIMWVEFSWYKFLLAVSMVPDKVRILHFHFKAIFTFIFFLPVATIDIAVGIYRGEFFGKGERRYFLTLDWFSMVKIYVERQKRLSVSVSKKVVQCCYGFVVDVKLEVLGEAPQTHLYRMAEPANVRLCSELGTSLAHIPDLGTTRPTSNLMLTDRVRLLALKKMGKATGAELADQRILYKDFNANAQNVMMRFRRSTTLPRGDVVQIVIQDRFWVTCLGWILQNGEYNPFMSYRNRRPTWLFVHQNIVVSPEDGEKFHKLLREVVNETVC